MGVRKVKNKRSVSFRAEKKIRGKRYSKSFKSDKAAWKWLKKMEKVFQTKHVGSNKKKPKMTVRQAMTRLIEVESKKGWDPRTIEAYMETLPHLPPILDKSITDLTVRELVDTFKGMRNLSNGKMLSQSRLYKFLGRLTRAFNIAARKGIAMKNFEDAEGEIVGYIRENGKAPVETMPYNEEELRLLLEYQAPPNKEPRWVLPLIKIYLMTGKRFGEIQALTNDMICHDTMIIKIQQMISGRMYHDHLKSRGKPHVVIMDEELSGIIKKLQAYNQANYSGSEWLFPSRQFRSREDFKEGKHKCPYKGQPIQDSAIKKFIGIRMNNSGAGHKKIHDLRKTYATLRLIQLLREGNPLAREVVKSELNHRHMRTTEKYIKIAENYLQDKSKENVISSFLDTNKKTDEKVNANDITGMMRMMGINPEEINWEAFWQILNSVTKLTKKAA